MGFHTLAMGARCMPDGFSEAGRVRSGEGDLEGGKEESGGVIEERGRG